MGLRISLQSFPCDFTCFITMETHSLQTPPFFRDHSLAINKCCPGKPGTASQKQLFGKSVKTTGAGKVSVFFKKTHTLYNTIFSKACFFHADLVISLTFIQLYNCLSPITTQLVLSQFYYLSIVTPFYLFKSVFQNRSAQISVQILMSPYTHSISDATATFPA